MTGRLIGDNGLRKPCAERRAGRTSQSVIQRQVGEHDRLPNVDDSSVFCLVERARIPGDYIYEGSCATAAWRAYRNNG